MCTDEFTQTGATYYSTKSFCLSGTRAHKVVLASASPFTNTPTHWVFPEDNTRICQGVGPNHKPNKLFYIEWQFLHARRQCTTHKLNENYIWTVEWWLALILAPSGGVGVNYSGLGQSESSISSEEFWGLDQWECSINAKKWARLLQQQWKPCLKRTETPVAMDTLEYWYCYKKN